jgi:hypothetical protein
LEEPSNGSINTTYFASLFTLSLKAIKESFSSEATPHITPLADNAFIKVSLAKTSSFCWSSPCTFSLPAEPKISFANPALLI